MYNCTRKAIIDYDGVRMLMIKRYVGQPTVMPIDANSNERLRHYDVMKQEKPTSNVLVKNGYE
jgi:hypothetical protein